jgi:hypothetical protein
VKLLSVPISAAILAVGLTCLVAPAQADIVVLKHHNSIDAMAYYAGGTDRHSDSSDLLQSSTGAVTSHHFLASAFAFLASALQLNNLAIQGDASEIGHGYKPYLPRWGGSADADTVLRFQVSTTAVYTVQATASSNASGGFVKLLRDGVEQFNLSSGSIDIGYVFEAGGTYEVDAHAYVIDVHKASYWFSLVGGPSN